MDQTTLTIVMVVILAVLIFFMFRSSRRRQKQQQELQKQVVPGATVMTNFGVFGTIVSIDEENNKVELETSPGHILTVHRQTIGRVETMPETTETVDADSADTEVEAAATDEKPQYGERIEDAGTASDTAESKKTDE
ncbi:preprotein translocase subunit YajC [Humibacter ginsenosidimutans]|uniref:preprotein translocase subunit YajC n=1 Tax=Humibacter ginsenosidimutans TaxID=2599293 RepID=UPI001FEF051A|nr:preprotein translocase subunit YajC [Humibacter ginsenosidimutans]